MIPSADRFFFLWKAFTDPSVAGPNSPSAVSLPAITLPPQAYPFEMSRVWAFFTALPVEPFFNCGMETIQVADTGVGSCSGTAAGVGVFATTAEVSLYSGCP